MIYLSFRADINSRKAIERMTSKQETGMLPHLQSKQGNEEEKYYKEVENPLRKRGKCHCFSPDSIWKHLRNQCPKSGANTRGEKSDEQ